MAVGNAIVTTARFKPLTVAEWSAPLEKYTTQHAVTEAALLELQDKAAEYEQYLIDHPDSPLTQKYNSYINDIDRLSEQLAVNGISPQTRTDLLNLRRDYSNVVKPIKTGISLYQKAAAKRNKDYNKGIIGPDITPEDFIYNPNYEDTYLLGTNIYTDAKNLFKGLTGFDSTPRQYNNGTSIITEIPQGYSSEEIQTLFADEENPNLTQELKDTWKLIKNKYGFDTLTPEQQEQFIYYALQGALSGTKPPRYSSVKAPKPVTTVSAGDQTPTTGTSGRNYDRS